jgi:hypothetical protein
MDKENKSINSYHTLIPLAAKGVLRISVWAAFDELGKLSLLEYSDSLGSDNLPC